MVERYQQQVRSRPAAQQDLTVRPTAEAFGAAVGRGMQQFGQGLQDVAEARAARDTLQAENDARSAVNRFREQARQIRYDPERGYLNQTGTNALNSRAAYEEQLAKARSDAARGMSPQAMREYDRLSQSIEDGAREEFIRHDSSQLRAVTNAEGQASVAGFLDEAMLNYNNPERFNEFLGRAIQEQNRIGALNGWSPEAAAQARRELVSGTHAGVAMRMADEGAGGASRANDYINEHREQFTAEDRAQLDSVVRPLLRRDRARTWVDGSVQGGGRRGTNYTQNGGGPAGVTAPSRIAEIHALTTDAYARETRRRESGTEQGRLDAAPRRSDGSMISSARGPYQFIEGTWLRMVERLREQGGAAWAEGMSRQEILEMRWTGGAMSDRPDLVRAANDEVFTEFRRYGTEALNRAGFEASPQNEYLLHIFGEGGGINVLRASPGARIESVIGDTAARNNRLIGVTVGQYRQRLARAYGNPSEPAPNGGDHDFAHLYRQAMSIEDPEERAAVLDELDTRRQIFERANSIERQNAFDERYQQGNETGNWDLSASDRMTLGAELSAAFTQAAQNAMRGIQHTDVVTYSDLKDLAVNNPEEFINTDLGFYRGENQLDDAAYDALRDLQRATRAQLEGRDQEAQAALDNLNTFQAFDQIAPIYENIVGYDPRDPKKDDRKKQVVQFREQLRQRMEQYTIENNGQAPGQSALQQIALELLTEVQLGQASWGMTGRSPTTDSFVFDVDRVRAPGADVWLPRTEHANIPADVRDTLDAFVYSVYGEDIDPARLRGRTELLYQIHQITNGPEALRGLTPDIDTADILADPDVASVVEVMPIRRARGLVASYKYKVDLGDGTEAELSDDELRTWYARMMAETLREEGFGR